jgi:2-iminobutanoate/2-iminopropanoate deaminase
VKLRGRAETPDQRLRVHTVLPRLPILESAGSSLDKVASVTVVLADEQEFQGMNEEWLKWFPSNPPARQGAKLPVKIPGLKVSIDAIAEA